MLEHLRSVRKSSPAASPLVVKPNFGRSVAPSTDDHPPEEIIDTVFRVLCGYESVSEACLRLNVKPSEYYGWHEHFVEICKQWSKKQLHAVGFESAAPANGPDLAEDSAPAWPDEADEAVVASSDLPEDIVRWAQDRLSVAWRADYQSLRLATR